MNLPIHTIAKKSKWNTNENRKVSVINWEEVLGHDKGEAIVKNLKQTRHWIVIPPRVAGWLSILIMLIWTATAPGQLGMGDRKGIVQQGLKPRLVRLSGTLQQIQTHPCESTTGKAELGTHLIIEDKDGQELNIHLGPASKVSEIAKRLTLRTRVDLLGFRTDKMPSNHYVAKTLILPNHIIPLRESDLRPYWSANRLSEKPPVPTIASSGKRMMSETEIFRYCPQYGRRRCFQNGARPRWGRRCRGRAY